MNSLKKGMSLKGGKYRIESKLGQGSFGITYLASTKTVAQGDLGKMEVTVRVAIKEFFMSDVNSRSRDGSSVEGSGGTVFTNYRKKFRKEAENLAKLSHSNIVRVFDVFDENGTTYYVMEYLDGQNLDDYIAARGRVPEKEAIAIIAEIGSALEYMHSRRMLHLDVKPKNVMHGGADDVCRLIDFGLSKQYDANGEPESSTSIGLGTPGYAPLEQAQYKQDGTFPATLDVYALGATLFKLLTGKRPPEATVVLNEGFPADELRALHISTPTIAALEKAMAPVKAMRYASIRDFVAALGSQLQGSASVDDDEDTSLDGNRRKDDFRGTRNSGSWGQSVAGGGASSQVQGGDNIPNPPRKPLKPAVNWNRRLRGLLKAYGIWIGVGVVVGWLILRFLTYLMAWGISDRSKEWAIYFIILFVVCFGVAAIMAFKVNKSMAWRKGFYFCLGLMLVSPFMMVYNYYNVADFRAGYSYNYTQYGLFYGGHKGKVGLADKFGHDVIPRDYDVIFVMDIFTDTAPFTETRYIGITEYDEEIEVSDIELTTHGWGSVTQRFYIDDGPYAESLGDAIAEGRMVEFMIPDRIERGLNPYSYSGSYINYIREENYRDRHPEWTSPNFSGWTGMNVLRLPVSKTPSIATEAVVEEAEAPAMEAASDSVYFYDEPAAPAE